MPRPHRAEALSNDARLRSVSVCLSRTSCLEQRGLTEVAQVTGDLDTTFKVKRSKVNLQGAGAYCGGLAHSLLCLSCPPALFVLL